MKTRLPRHEIETICILLAMRDGPCPIEALARRLGLAIALARRLAACVEPLLRDGRIVTIGAELSLSAPGHAWLGARLEDIGLA